MAVDNEIGYGFKEEVYEKALVADHSRPVALSPLSSFMHSCPL